MRPIIHGTIAELSDGFKLATGSLLPTFHEGQALDTDGVLGIDPANLRLDVAREVTIVFQGEVSKFQNTLGVYEINTAGEITGVRIVFPQVNGSIYDPTHPQLQDGRGPLVEGESSYSLGTVPAGTQLGFFLIQKGATLDASLLQQDGIYEFRNAVTGEPAKIGDQSPPVLVHVANDGTQTVVHGLIFHTTDSDATTPENSLNPDGITHAVSGLTGDLGGLVISFEDQVKTNRYFDGDYNDNTFEVRFGSAYAEHPSGTNVGTDGRITDTDSVDMSAATVRIVSGLQAGDGLAVLGQADRNGDGVIDGTSISYTQVSATEIHFSGLDLKANYETALNYVRYLNDSGTVGAGLREIALTVSDDKGLTSNPAIVQVALADTILRGTDQANTIHGSDQGDVISGRDGNDVLIGGAGNDLIDGGAGNDTIEGGTGDDYLNGGPGSDMLTGGSGADTFRIGALTERVDTILDFNVNEGDRLDMADLLQNSGFDPNQYGKWLQFEVTQVDGQGGANDVKVLVDLDGPSGTGYQPTLVAQLVNPVGLIEQINAGTLEIDRLVISRRADHGAGIG